MAGWVTLPTLVGMFPFRLREPGFHRTNPIVNLDDFLALVGVLLPILFVIWASGDGWKRFGLKPVRWSLDLPWALGCFGAGMMVYIPLNSLFPLSLPPIQGAPVALSIVLLALVVGVWEELFFRGYLIPRLEEITEKSWVAVLVSALLFAIGHFGYGPPGAVGAFIFGLLAGAAYTARRSVWPLALAHMGVNLAITWMY